MLKKRDYSVRQVQILFLVFHMIMVAYAVMFLHPYYGSNDEFTLAASHRVLMGPIPGILFMCTAPLPGSSGFSIHCIRRGTGIRW